MSKNIKDQQILVEGGVGSVVNPYEGKPKKENITNMLLRKSAAELHNRNFASYTFATNARDGTWPGSEFGEEQDWLIRKDKGGYKEAIYRHHTTTAADTTPDLIETMCVDRKDVEAMEKAGEAETVRDAALVYCGVSYEPHMSNEDQVFINGAEFGYQYAQPTIDRLTAENKALMEALDEVQEQKHNLSKKWLVLREALEDFIKYCYIGCSQKELDRVRLKAEKALKTK